MLTFVFDTETETNLFMHLYETYRHYIMYTIRRYIKDEFTQDDLYQEILIKLAAHVKEIQFSDKEKAKNYVITVSKNYCLNYLDKQKRSKIVLYGDTRELEDEKPAPLDWILRQDAKERLYREVEKLGDKYQAVLSLKYIYGFNDGKIAEMLGITKENVRKRLTRAKVILRERLAGTEES